MTPETLEWLSIKVPGFSNLTEEGRDAIDDFSFLWSLFEGKVMDGRCDVPRLRRYAQRLEQKDRLNEIACEQYMDYLRNRYYRDGHVTHYFHGLHLERSGNPEEVIDALSNLEASNPLKIVACLIIIFRIRNNLFHGEKWRYDLEGQLYNFAQANLFLKSLMHGDMNG